MKPHKNLHMVTMNERERDANSCLGFIVFTCEYSTHVHVWVGVLTHRCTIEVKKYPYQGSFPFHRTVRTLQVVFWDIASHLTRICNIGWAGRRLLPLSSQAFPTTLGL